MTVTSIASFPERPSGTRRRPRPPGRARVLAALILREMTTRFGRSSLGYLWALIEPAGFIALLSLAFAEIAHSPPIGRSFPLFYASGYVIFSFYNEIAALTGRAVEVNRPLLAYPVLTPLDAVLARFLLQVLTGLAVAAVIFGGILLAFPEPVRVAPLPLMAAFGLAALLGLGVGLVNVSLFALSRGWQTVYGIVSRPLFLVSAVFFTYQSLPVTAREILWWNPILHLVGLVRAGIYPTYDGAHVTPLYVLALGLGLVVAGLVLMTLCRNRLAEQG